MEVNVPIKGQENTYVQEVYIRKTAINTYEY